MKAIAVAALVLLAGCSTADQIRTSDPLAERTVQANWKDMLACFAEKQQGTTYPHSQVVREHQQRATLMATLPGAFPTPVWEIAFQGASEDTTRVEYRGRSYGVAFFERWSAECEAAEQ